MPKPIGGFSDHLEAFEGDGRIGRHGPLRLVPKTPQLGVGISGRLQPFVSNGRIEGDERLQVEGLSTSTTIATRTRRRVVHGTSRSGTSAAGPTPIEIARS
jgi:hypothetical protein